jgi:hypothetical protein
MAASGAMSSLVGVAKKLVARAIEALACVDADRVGLANGERDGSR